MIRRSAGFTLVEMMVSLSLGAVILAGAFQIHTAFTRQAVRSEQVADMQQSLRVARQVMERLIRGAGSGLQNGALNVNQCNGPAKTYYSVQFSNSNDYPQLAVDATPGDTDADPDWIQIVSSDPTFGVGGWGSLGANITVTDKTQFAVGDLFIAVNTSGDPNRKDCVMEITHIDNAGGGKCATCGALQHNAGQSCINLNPAQDTCIQALTFPAPIKKLSANTAVFRIINNSLQVSFAKLQAQPDWQLVAENIEDLQIALVMADGRICGAAGNSIDDPALCPPQQVKAVRFTLTARSSSPVPGYAAGQTIPAEDEAAAVGNDGYLRRSVTSEVQLRNNP